MTAISAARRRDVVESGRQRGAGAYEAVSNEVAQSRSAACEAITVNNTTSPRSLRWRETVFVGALASKAPTFTADAPVLTGFVGINV